MLDSIMNFALKVPRQVQKKSGIRCTRLPVKCCKNMGFAPMEHPQIAICVYVENAGFGATYGVPIGSLMMEMYLNGEISESRKYMETQMLEASTTGYPRTFISNNKPKPDTDTNATKDSIQ